MKRHDAFAFNGFDSKKILQRPFFKAWREKYHVGDKTDAEILSALTAYYSDIRLTETKHEMLTEMLIRLENLSKLIQRHANAMDGRLEKFRRRVMQSGFDDSEVNQRKIERVENLSRKYIVDIARAVGDLSVDVKRLWQDSERDLPNEYRRRFGERLKEAREKAGLSRKKFAAKCNLSMQQVHYYENGLREPSLTSLKRFARTLGVSADWLLELS